MYDEKTPSLPGIFSYNLLYPQLLMVQSCKLCNNKYMIALTQVTNTNIFTFKVFLIFPWKSKAFSVF